MKQSPRGFWMQFWSEPRASIDSLTYNITHIHARILQSGSQWKFSQGSQQFWKFCCTTWCKMKVKALLLDYNNIHKVIVNYNSSEIYRMLSITLSLLVSRDLDHGLWLVWVCHPLLDGHIFSAKPPDIRKIWNFKLVYNTLSSVWSDICTMQVDSSNQVNPVLNSVI